MAERSTSLQAPSLGKLRQFQQPLTAIKAITLTFAALRDSFCTSGKDLSSPNHYEALLLAVW